MVKTPLILFAMCKENLPSWDNFITKFLQDRYLACYSTFSGEFLLPSSDHHSKNTSLLK